VALQEVTIPTFLKDYFGYKNSMKGWTILILVAYVLFFAFNATLALNRLNFMRRRLRFIGSLLSCRTDASRGWFSAQTVYHISYITSICLSLHQRPRAARW